MLTIESLKEYGANVEEGLKRCMDNEEFYLKMVRMLIEKNTVGALKEAIEANDLDKAFEAAPALKGVVTNLSLTPISDPAVEITELLRSRTEMDYTDLVNKICGQMDALTALEN